MKNMLYTLSQKTLLILIGRGFFACDIHSIASLIREKFFIFFMKTKTNLPCKQLRKSILGHFKCCKNKKPKNDTNYFLVWL